MLVVFWGKRTRIISFQKCAPHGVEVGAKDWPVIGTRNARSAVARATVVIRQARHGTRQSLRWHTDYSLRQWRTPTETTVIPAAAAVAATCFVAVGHGGVAMAASAACVRNVRGGRCHKQQIWMNMIMCGYAEAIGAAPTHLHMTVP